MIEYIQIKNYQSHVCSRLDLSPGMTAITGQSMNGKTAIKRAIEWLRTNRPLGFRFSHRYNDDPTEVEIGVDGHVVKATKSTKALDAEGNKAVYSILYPDGNEKIFSAFGTDVPKKVKELLSISDISIQDQLDAYLLVISSSGEIARTINRITGIDIGDHWLKDINKSLSSVNNEHDRLDGDISFLSTDIKKYEGVDDLEKVIQTATLLQAEYKSQSSIHDGLVDSINQYNSAKQWRKEITNQISPLLELEEKYDSVVEEIQFIKEEIEAITDTMLLGESGKDIKSALDFLSPEMEKIQDLIDMKKRRDNIAKILAMYVVSRGTIDSTKIEIEKNSTELKQLLENMGVCTFCGGEINQSRITNILERI
jgi:exonuclease SbcC